MRKTIYPNLNAEMARHGVSVLDVAKDLSKSHKTVYNWLSGSTSISQENCVAIRDKFFGEMSTDYLFARHPIDSSEKETRI